MLVCIAVLALLAGQPSERVAEIQIHGNTLTPDAQIIALSGLQVGAPMTADTVRDVETRLRAAHLFEDVEVLKRFASIADPSQIAIVIIVDEGRVKVLDDGAGVPGTVVKRRGPDLMMVPIVTAEDGYGLAYGVQLSVPEPFGPGSRVSFPLTWGGDKRAGVEVEVPAARGPITRARAGAALSRREHPFFDDNDDRRGVWVRAERDAGRRLRFGATAAIEQISFLGATDRHTEFGTDVVVDTRIDPFLSRHAVYGRAAWSRLQFGRSPNANRSELEARGYIGAPLASVLVVRVSRQDSSRALPPALRPILGGAANLRGFAAGSFIGDTLVATSVEWRLPLNSRLSTGKLGVSAFVDAARVYDKGSRIGDRPFEKGAGVGLWLAVMVFRANLFVAHGVGNTTRAHFTLSASF